MPKYIIKDQSGNKILSYSGDAPPDQSQVKEAIDSYYLIQAQNNYAKDFNAAQSQGSQFSQTLAALPPIDLGVPTQAQTQELNPFEQAIQESYALKAKELDQLVKQNEQMGGVGIGTTGKVERLPEFSFDQLPQFQSDGVSQFTMTGMVSPEEDRARLMKEWEAVPVGQDIVNPLVGRIRKTGGTKFQVINPNEKAGFLDNVGAGGQFVRNAITRGAIGLGGALAGDQDVVGQMKEGLATDYEKYKEPLKESGKVAGAMASRVLPVLVPAIRGAQIGVPALMGLGATGEVGAELIEGRELSPIEIALAGATAPIGFNNLAPGTGLLKGLAQRTGEGAFISGANIAGQKIDDLSEGRPVEFNQGDLTNLAVGTAIGGLAGAGEGIANKGLQVLNKAKEPPPMANIATQNAANMAGDTNAVQASINQITTRPPTSPAQQSAEVFERALQQQDEAAEVQRALEAQEINKQLQAQEAAAQFRQTETQAQLLKEQLAQEQAVAQSIAERQAIAEQRQLADIQAEVQAFPELQEGFPELSPQAQRMYDDYGRVSPGLLPIVSSGAAGGVGGSLYGATQGETPEERAANALRYGGLGMVAAPALTAGVQALSRRLNQPRAARQFTGAMEPQMLDDIVPVEAGSMGNAPANFLGVQEGLPSRGVPDIELYNITQDIPGHPAGSTVSRRTLEANGYTVPQRDAAPTPTLLSSPIEEVPQSTPEFLYRETYPTRTGETKTANYFQVDKTPENPRGVTVDDAALVERGYTTEQIQKMADDIIAGKGAPFIGGAQTGAAMNPVEFLQRLKKRMRGETEVPAQPKTERVSVPETQGDEFVPATTARIIRDTDNPVELRKALAEDESQIAQKLYVQSMNSELEGKTIDELRALAQAEAIDPSLAGKASNAVTKVALYNKLVANGYSDEAKQILDAVVPDATNSAQYLNVMKLIKSPEDYARKIDELIFETSGRNLSQADREAITGLRQNMLKAETKRSELLAKARENISDRNNKRLMVADRRLAEKEYALESKVAALMPKEWGDFYGGLIKTALLGTRTITYGAASNVLQAGIDQVARAAASGSDYVVSLGGKRRPREFAGFNPFPSPESIKASAQTAVRNLGELITGPKAQAFVDGQGSIGARPLREIAQGLGGESMPVIRRTYKDEATGKLITTEYTPLQDRLFRVLKGVLNIPAAPMQRLINLSDNPFRELRRMALLTEQADLRKLTGAERDLFMLAPPDDVARRIEAEASRSVLQQKTVLTKGLAKALRTFSESAETASIMAKNPAGKAMYRQMGQVAKVLESATVPFVNIPLASAERFLTFGVPGYGQIKAAMQYASGDIRGAQITLAETAVGAGTIAAGVYLYNLGVLTPPFAKDPKERAIQYAGIGPGQLNVTALQRYFKSGNKEDAKFKSGDTVRDYSQISSLGGVLALTAKAKSMGIDLSRQPDDEGKGNLFSNLYMGAPSVAMNMTPLMNASSLVDALASDDPDKIARFAYNLQRAIVAPAFAPKTLDDFASLKYDNRVDLQSKNPNLGKRLLENFENLYAYKYQQLPADSAVFTRDIWGRKISSHKNANPIYHTFIDPFKSGVVKAEPWEIEVRNIYEASGNNPDAYPPLPSRRVDVLGEVFELDKKDAEILAEERGTMYANRVKAITQNPKWTQLPPQAKVYVLKEIYNRVNTEHGMVIKASPQFRAKYDKPVSKSTKKLLQEEIRNQGVAR